MSTQKHKYRSRFEKVFHQKFPWLEYEPETFPYRIEETRKYTPDFIDEEGVWYELKGRFTAIDRKKMLLVKNQYPNQEIIMVFMKPNNMLTKCKGSKSYAAWCELHGIKWTTMDKLEQILKGK